MFMGVDLRMELIRLLLMGLRLLVRMVPGLSNGYKAIDLKLFVGVIVYRSQGTDRLKPTAHGFNILLIQSADSSLFNVLLHY